jgi:ribosomal protein S12 methylthiotransferase
MSAEAEEMQVRSGQYWIHTLGCPKNQVDSDKLAGTLSAEGLRPASAPEDADLLVVNTCAFIEPARQESVDTILELHANRRSGARLVVTGCLAERSGPELADAMPEIDLVAGFGASLTEGLFPGRVPVSLGSRPSRAPSFDLLELPRPAASAPWAYLKVAEGCDRACGFCAIPSFRGKQRSRRHGDLLAEAEALATGGPGGQPVREIVLVAQDLASYGRDRASGRGARSAAGAGAVAPIIELVRDVSALFDRTRLLYLYPSALTDELAATIVATGVPYFDLSLQHVSRPHLARMRRWGAGERFLDRISWIRRLDAQATFRSSFILGYPGETEEDHDRLLGFLESAQLDWAGFFLFSPEEGTHAVTLADQVPKGLALERLQECSELQDAITANRRDQLVGQRRTVLVDTPGIGRTIHEAPEIDGVVRVPESLAPGTLIELLISASLGTDLEAVLPDEPLADSRSSALAGMGLA